VRCLSIITSSAERKSAIEFAKAKAIRPQIVGASLQKISRDAGVSGALFAVLEAQTLIDGEARITLLPEGSPVLADLLAAESSATKPQRPKPEQQGQ
jgi:hypothetical protein